MKFGVVVFPGSNCDEDMVYALRAVLGQKVEKLWHKDHDLKGCDFIVLPGGFSYGDYLRSGAIARFSPIMNEVISFANKGGYVLGICNGFQILTEAALLPGALLHNNHQKFICKNICIKPITTDTAITADLDKNTAYQIPIAHAEGRYFASAETLQELHDNNQVLFKYASPSGEIQEAHNPNGSIENIAGVCNTNRNVFGMMPHPERAVDTILENTDGKFLFDSLLNNIALV